MTRTEIILLLTSENPDIRADEIHLYADAFLSYAESIANVKKNGLIVSHPRTGAPIQNPYLPVMEAARKAIQQNPIPNVEQLWKSITE